MRESQFSFSYCSPEDLLNALQEDLQELEANPSSSRHAIHCALLGWHLHEWIWATMFKGDHLAQQRVFGRQFSERKNFAAGIRQECSQLEIMQEVAEGSKHLGTSAAVSRTVDNLHDAVPGRAIPGQIILGSPGVLGVQLKDGSTVAFLPAIRAVVAYWTRIISA